MADIDTGSVRWALDSGAKHYLKMIKNDPDPDHRDIVACLVWLVEAVDRLEKRAASGVTETAQPPGSGR